METAVATYGALGAIAGVFGLLVRSLLKADDRWQKILDAQRQELAAVGDDRDRWRARAIACEAAP